MKEMLNGGWALTEQGISAQVPGSVLNDLLCAHAIPDPFFRENEFDALRLFDRDWTYECKFCYFDTLREYEKIELVFEGLDTIADVSLNGQEILHADNMHITWRVDVKELLQEENLLRVKFLSPNRYIAQAADENPDITYDGTGYTRGSNFLRKAHCMFGWDWGPQLPDAGIWRPVYLEGYHAMRLDNALITQTHENGRVFVRVAAEYEGARPDAIHVLLNAPDGTKKEYQGVGDTVQFEVSSPELWWPNGLGEQSLYTIEITCSCGKDTQKITRRIGLRDMTVSQEKDEWGEEFSFMVNGVRFFAMGADYIPEDSILARVNKNRTKKLLSSCVRAHFNCIRVWGGGQYPNDDFYDLCDEMGLVVWQDLMFACNIYKLTEHFTKSICTEAAQNIARIRHHACLGLLCANNEMETAWLNWDEIKCHAPALKRDYLIQNEYLLKNICREKAPQTFFWPSSPSSGGSFDDPNSFDRGDVHDWSVWHGMAPYDDYKKKYPRFCSEFGFESFPCMKTIEAFTLPTDRNVFSRVMESHQKCKGGNGKILFYLSRNLLYPSSFEHLVYASQVLQADAIRYGVEHWRRNRGRCMGAIYWQLNDCWPVASWSSMDYYLRPKALQYAAARFFAPQMISCDRTGAKVQINVANDSRNAFAGLIQWRLLNSAGDTLARGEKNVHVDAMSAQWQDEFDFSLFLDKTVLHPLDNAALHLRLLDENGNVVNENTELFTEAKFFALKDPQIAFKASEDDTHYYIDLLCEHLALSVCLDTKQGDCIFSDNWFTLLPNENKRVTVEKRDVTDIKTLYELEQTLTITSLYDIDK